MRAFMNNKIEDTILYASDYIRDAIEPMREKRLGNETLPITAYTE